MRFLEVAFKHFTPEDIFMKKHKYLLLAFLLPALFLCGCNPAPTIDEELKKQLDGEFEYELTADGSVTITKYTGSAETVTIPRGVTSIGNEAFSWCNSLTSVTIPDSVTSIGGGPFAGCEKLTKILVSVGNTHFKTVDGILFTDDGKTLIQVPAGKGLTEYTIPDGVTSIGGGSFAGCDQLTEIRVSAGNTHFKSVDGILFTADGKTLIQVPAGKGLTEYTIPNSVTSIGNYAFYKCSSLTSVTIPNSVTSIGDEAFYYCSSLTSVTIPDSVTSIGDGPFARCYKLTEIQVSAGNTHFKSVDGILFSADGKTLIRVPGGLTEYTIPDGVTSIGSSAFCYYDSLTSVTIPDSVTSIGDRAFLHCHSLTWVTIPNSVTSIGDFVFSHCWSLTSVTIPNSVTSIGDSAFSHCTSLKWVTIPNSVTSIGDSAFSECESLWSVTIPDSVTSIGNKAFYWCTSLKSVTIPNSVTSIGDEAFYWCSEDLVIYVTAENGIQRRIGRNSR